jgi:cytochrome-b5 reductase
MGPHSVLIKHRTSSSSSILRRHLYNNIFAIFLFIVTIQDKTTTMSRAQYVPDSLQSRKPVCSLVPPGKCQLNDQFQSLELIERVKVSPTSSVLRFALPDRTKPLNLSTCACILAHTTMTDGEDVVRPYTPISTNALTGCFDLLVKDYGEDAKMSRELCCRMKVGDTIDFKHIEFNVKIQAPFLRPKTICMLVGGTGITPMIQALHAILGDSDCRDTHVTMLYGSKTLDDILGREMLDQWAKDYSQQLVVEHILSEEPLESEWTGMRGYIDRERIEKYLPTAAVGEDVLIFVCGPPPLYNALCGPREENDEIKGIMGEMGYQPNQVYKF